MFLGGRIKARAFSLDIQQGDPGDNMGGGAEESAQISRS